MNALDELNGIIRNVYGCSIRSAISCEWALARMRYNDEDRAREAHRELGEWRERMGMIPVPFPSYVILWNS